MSDPRPSRSRSTTTGLVLGAAVSMQFGAAVAALVFPTAGPMGMVALRLAFGALVLLVVRRPRLRGRSGSDWLLVTAFGLALAAMNTMLYHSIDLIPLGVAVTFEVLGPLTLYVVLGRRLHNLLWAVLALAGVYLIGGGDMSGLDGAGVALALGAATAWAAYILLGARVAQRFDGPDGLALALAAGAVVAVPFGLASTGTALLEPRVLGIGLLVALLSSALPYSLEQAALRRVTAGSFAMMMSLYPLIAALAGLLVLGQRLGGTEVVGIVAVTVAMAGATKAGQVPRTRPGHEPA